MEVSCPPELPHNAPTVLDFFRQFSAYHIMPTSARILAIDSKTTLYKAFRIMNDNLVSSAFVWDRDEELYKSVLTATDIMKACIGFYHAYFAQTAKYSLEDLERELELDHVPTLSDILSFVSIRSIKIDTKKIYFAQTQTSLKDAISQMEENHIHRLPILDNDGSVIATLTYRSICRFLVSKFRFHSEVLEMPIMSTGIVDTTRLITVHKSLSILETIQVLVENTLSVVPVLDDDGLLYDVFSKYDFANMATSELNLALTVENIIGEREEHMEGLVTTKMSSNVGHVLRMIADKNLHRMILVDDENERKLVAVVSLRHVLKFLTEQDVYIREEETRAKRSNSVSEEPESLEEDMEDAVKQWDLLYDRLDE